VSPPRPEGLGYDLCDLEVADDDARWWLARLPGEHRIAVLGIRTGGSYLAPLWATRSEDGAYATVRPLGRAGSRCYLARELDGLGACCAAATDVVITDDQPNTGETVLALADVLGKRHPDLRLWLASPGRIYRIAHAALRQERRARPLAPRDPVPLWRLLRSPERLVARIAATIPGIADDLDVVWRVRGLSARYEAGRCWLPWDAPALEPLDRRLINPHKTPFTLVQRRTGAPVWHARFIGESPFGDEEAARVRRFGRLAGPGAVFVDGYLLTRHCGDLTELRVAYLGAPPADRARLRHQVAAYLSTLERDAVLRGGRGGRVALRAELERGLAALERRLSVPAAPWPRERVPEAIERSGTRGVLVRSSLRYSHPSWHWQVSASLEVRRFQIDANWGQSSSIDLELASFLLDVQFPPEDLGALLAEFAPDPAYRDALARGVRDRLGHAVLLWIETWLRGVRRPADHAAGLIRDELDAMWSYIERAEPWLR
jgi:neamine phosphoribosyltransferase